MLLHRNGLLVYHQSNALHYALTLVVVLYSFRSVLILTYMSRYSIHEPAYSRLKTLGTVSR